MGNENKEQEFLNLFDTHVDALFSHCFSRIPDRAQSDELIEKTFKRGWDEMVEGKQLRVAEFYRLLDELVNTRIRVRGLSLPALFSYFSGKMEHSS